MSLFEFIFNPDAKRSDINELKSRAKRQQLSAAKASDQAKHKISTLESQVTQLQQQVGELQMISRAMLEMLKRNETWDDALFERTLLEIDLEDGIQDGRVTN